MSGERQTVDDGCASIARTQEGLSEGTSINFILMKIRCARVSRRARNQRRSADEETTSEPSYLLPAVALYMLY